MVKILLREWSTLESCISVFSWRPWKALVPDCSQGHPQQNKCKFSTLHGVYRKNDRLARMCICEIHNQGRKLIYFWQKKYTDFLFSKLNNFFYFLMELDDSNTILFVLDSTFSPTYQIWKISKIPKTVNIVTPGQVLSEILCQPLMLFFLSKKQTKNCLHSTCLMLPLEFISQGRTKEVLVNQNVVFAESIGIAYQADQQAHSHNPWCNWFTINGFLKDKLYIAAKDSACDLPHPNWMLFQLSYGGGVLSIYPFQGNREEQ